MAKKKPLTGDQVKEWLRSIYKDFSFDVVGLTTRNGGTLPLNLEPGTLGNIVETALIEHLDKKILGRTDVSLTRGGIRHYPDVELSGTLFNRGIVAVDIKAARRSQSNPNRTQSRITLYTFGTYLKYQDKKFPQTLRPFKDYMYHIDVIAFFDVDENAGIGKSVSNFELAVIDPWRVASKTPSSATRDYVGAIMEIDNILSETGGQFSSQEEFYEYWASVPRRGQKR